MFGRKHVYIGQTPQHGQIDIIPGSRENHRSMPEPGGRNRGKADSAA
jgi:hypothetical protein